MVNFTLPFTTNKMISISTSQTFRSWVVIFHLCRPTAFLFQSLYDTPGCADRINVLFWGPGNFPASYSNRDTSCIAGNRHSGILWSIRGSYSATYVKWHSDPWPVTMISQSIRLSTKFMTLIPDLTFTELRVVSMEHLQRVWLASRERLPFRTPSSALPLWGLAYDPILDQLYRTCSIFSRLFTLNTPRYFLDVA